MNRQPAIAALQQQLNQLDVLRNDQLNGLLKRLESQKARLPLEDHPIIDWGIGIVQAKMREEEQWMNGKINQEPVRLKYVSYQAFREETRWDLFKLQDPTQRNKLLREGANELHELVKLDKNYQGRYKIVRDCTPLFKDYLRMLLSEQQQDGRYNDFISEYKRAFQGSYKKAYEDGSPFAPYYAELISLL